MSGDEKEQPLKTFDAAIEPKPSSEMAAEGEHEGPVVSEDDRGSGLIGEGRDTSQVTRDVTLLPPD